MAKDFNNNSTYIEGLYENTVYPGLWNVIQQTAEEEEKKRKKQRYQPPEKVYPVPPSLRTSSELVRPDATFEPKPLVYEAKASIFNSFPEVMDKTRVMQKRPRIEEEGNRFIEVLRGKIDPYLTRPEVLKKIQFATEMEGLRNKALRGEYEGEATGFDWNTEDIEAKKRVNLDLIKQGLANGELILQPSDYTEQKFFVNDPQTQSVKEEKLRYPVGYFVYGLLDREINGQRVKAPTIKPLYYVDSNGEVKDMRDPALQRLVRGVGTAVFGPENWDKILYGVKALATTITGGKPTPGNIPTSAIDAFIGFSSNLPFSRATQLEPGGKPVPRGNYPVYTDVTPTQKQINENPYNFTGYGLGNLVYPTFDVATVATGGLPQIPPNTPSVGLLPTDEAIQEFEKRATTNEFLGTLYNTITMLPALSQKALSKMIGMAFITQPFATEPNRPLWHKIAEGLTNAAILYSLGKIGVAHKSIQKGLPVNKNILISDALKRIGVGVSGEVFRKEFFYPNLKEEDVWQTIKPYAYTLGTFIAMEAYQLPWYRPYIRKDIYEMAKKTNLASVGNLLNTNIRPETVSEVAKFLDASGGIGKDIASGIKTVERIAQKPDILPNEAREQIAKKIIKELETIAPAPTEEQGISTPTETPLGEQPVAESRGTQPTEEAIPGLLPTEKLPLQLPEPSKVLSPAEAKTEIIPPSTPTKEGNEIITSLPNPIEVRSISNDKTYTVDKLIIRNSGRMYVGTADGKNKIPLEHIDIGSQKILEPAKPSLLERWEQEQLVASSQVPSKNKAAALQQTFREFIDYVQRLPERPSLQEGKKLRELVEGLDLTREQKEGMLSLLGIGLTRGMAPEVTQSITDSARRYFRANTKLWDVYDEIPIAKPQSTTIPQKVPTPTEKVENLQSTEPPVVPKEDVNTLKGDWIKRVAFAQPINFQYNNRNTNIEGVLLNANAQPHVAIRKANGELSTKPLDKMPPIIKNDPRIVSELGRLYEELLIRPGGAEISEQPKPKKKKVVAPPETQQPQETKLPGAKIEHSGDISTMEIQPTTIKVGSKEETITKLRYDAEDHRISLITNEGKEIPHYKLADTEQAKIADPVNQLLNAVQSRGGELYSSIVPGLPQLVKKIQRYLQTRQQTRNIKKEVKTLFQKKPVEGGGRLYSTTGIPPTIVEKLFAEKQLAPDYIDRIQKLKGKYNLPEETMDKLVQFYIQAQSKPVAPNKIKQQIIKTLRPFMKEVKKSEVTSKPTSSEASRVTKQIGTTEKVQEELPSITPKELSPLKEQMAHNVYELKNVFEDYAGVRGEKQQIEDILQRPTTGKPTFRESDLRSEAAKLGEREQSIKQSLEQKLAELKEQWKDNPTVVKLSQYLEHPDISAEKKARLLRTVEKSFTDIPYETIQRGVPYEMRVDRFFPNISWNEALTKTHNLLQQHIKSLGERLEGKGKYDKGIKYLFDLLNPKENKADKISVQYSLEEIARKLVEGSWEKSRQMLQRDLKDPEAVEQIMSLLKQADKSKIMKDGLEDYLLHKLPDNLHPKYREVIQHITRYVPTLLDPKEVASNHNFHRMLSDIRDKYIRLQEEIRSTKQREQPPLQKIMDRAYMLMESGEKNPVVIYNKLRDEFPQNDALDFPTREWIKLQLDLNYGDIPPAPKTLEDYRDWKETHIDREILEQFDRRRQGRVLQWYDNLVKRIIPGGRFKPEVLSVPSASTLRDASNIVRSIITRNSAAEQIRDVNATILADRIIFADALQEGLFAQRILEGGFQNEFFKKLKFPQDLRLLNRVITDTYINRWYQEVKQSAKQIGKVYQALEPVLDTINQHSHYLVAKALELPTILGQIQKRFATAYPTKPREAGKQVLDIETRTKLEVLSDYIYNTRKFLGIIQRLTNEDGKIPEWQTLDLETKKELSQQLRNTQNVYTDVQAHGIDLPPFPGPEEDAISGLRLQLNAAMEKAKAIEGTEGDKQKWFYDYYTTIMETEEALSATRRFFGELAEKYKASGEKLVAPEELPSLVEWLKGHEKNILRSEQVATALSQRMNELFAETYLAKNDVDRLTQLNDQLVGDINKIVNQINGLNELFHSRTIQQLGKDPAEIQDIVANELAVNDKLRRAVLQGLISNGWDIDQIYYRIKSMSPTISKEKFAKDLQSVYEPERSQPIDLGQYITPEQIKEPYELVLAPVLKEIYNQTAERLAQEMNKYGLSPIQDSPEFRDRVIQAIGVDNFVDWGWQVNDMVDRLNLPADKAAEIKQSIIDGAAHYVDLPIEFREMLSRYSMPPELSLGEELPGDILGDTDKLYMHPTTLLPLAGALASYILPDDQKELKRLLLYGSIAATGGIAAWRMLQNWRRYNSIFGRNSKSRSATLQILESEAYKEFQQRYANDPGALERVKQSLQEIARDAESFHGQPLIILQKHNKLAKKIYKSFKQIEEHIGGEIYNLKNDINRFLGQYSNEELGAISNAVIQTQRKLYQLRSILKQSSPDEKAKQTPGPLHSTLQEEVKRHKDIFLKQYIQQAILDHQLVEPGDTVGLERMTNRLLDGTRRYRDWMRKATELHYRIQAAKATSIPIHMQDQVFKDISAQWERVEQEYQDKIADFKNKKRQLNRNLKDLKQWIVKQSLGKIFEKILQQFLRTRDYQNLRKLGLGLEDIPDLSSVLQRLKQAYYKNPTPELAKEINEFKDRLSKIGLYEREVASTTEEMKKYQKVFNEKYKALKNIKKILDPATIEKYIDRSENSVFWNPLWQRTFGDYGVKLYSYMRDENGDLVPKPETRAPVKWVGYDYSPQKIRNKAEAYLKQNGYRESPIAEGLWHNPETGDYVKMTQYNRKLLDIQKGRTVALVDNLYSFYHGFAAIYKNLKKQQFLNSEDYHYIQTFKDKVKEGIKNLGIDSDAFYEETGLDIDKLAAIAAKRDQNVDTLGQILATLRAAKSSIPMLRYRDFIGYETNPDLSKEGALFKYAILKHLDNLREQGLDYNVLAYLNNNVEPFILHYNLQHTPFAEQIAQLKQDLLYSPTSAFQKGIIRVKDKIFDLGEKLHTLSSLAYFYVFFGNLTAAYRNMKYNYLANAVNQIAGGRGIIDTYADLISKTPHSVIDFLKYMKQKFRQDETPPVISQDPLKQATFERLYKAGVFTQSVLDALSASSATLKLSDFLKTPMRKSDISKLLTFKLGLVLQRQSEVYNKLVDFETRYEFLRRNGYTDPIEMANEIAVKIGEDVGYYQTYELGRLTRYLSSHPLTALFTHMIKPAVIQVYNYLDTIKIPAEYLRDRIMREPNPRITWEEAKSHIKSLGALMVATTLIAGWRGTAVIGDILDWLDKQAEEINKSNPNFDPRGSQKIRLQLKRIAHDELGMSYETFDRAMLATEYGIDSYLTGRNLSIDNTLHPMLQPFMVDLAKRIVDKGAALLGGKSKATDLLVPPGIERVANYIKDISTGNVLLQSKYIDYHSGRPITLKDALFGFMGTSISDMEARRLQRIGYYDFSNISGRKDFIQKSLNRIISGKGKAEIIASILSSIEASDPEYKLANEIYMNALDRYKQEYADYVVDAKEHIGKKLQLHNVEFSHFFQELKNKPETYGKPRELDRYISVIMNNIANYYQMLALYEAYSNILGDSVFLDTGRNDDVMAVQGAPIEEQGLLYAINKLKNSVKKNQWQKKVSKQDIQEWWDNIDDMFDMEGESIENNGE